MNTEALVKDYVDDLNQAIKSREFPQLVGKWFAEDAVWSIKHEATGKETAGLIFTHLLPVGQKSEEGVHRNVEQSVYKVADGRVFTYRALGGGNAPFKLYGMQETQFDDRTMISELKIQSVFELPEINVDEAAATTRLGRIFMAFAEAFNEYFQKGNADILLEWCSDDLKMYIDSTFWGMQIIAPHHRIQESTEFTLDEVEEAGDSAASAKVEFVNWGGLDGTAPWQLQFTPEGKIRELHVTLDL